MALCLIAWRSSASLQGQAISYVKNALKEVPGMSRMPSNRSGQSFIEYALMIILVAIVLLSILLILGDDLRTFINDLLLAWFPAG